MSKETLVDKFSTRDKSANPSDYKIHNRTNDNDFDNVNKSYLNTNYKNYNKDKDNKFIVKKIDLNDEAFM